MGGTRGLHCLPGAEEEEEEKKTCMVNQANLNTIRKMSPSNKFFPPLSMRNGFFRAELPHTII